MRIVASATMQCAAEVRVKELDLCMHSWCRVVHES